MNNSQTNKTTLLTSWLVVILTSLLPRVILQEIFGQTVSPAQQAVMSLGVLAAALLATLIWKPLKELISPGR